MQQNKLRITLPSDDNRNTLRIERYESMADTIASARRTREIEVEALDALRAACAIAATVSDGFDVQLAAPIISREPVRIGELRDSITAANDASSWLDEIEINRADIEAVRDRVSVHDVVAFFELLGCTMTACGNTLRVDDSIIMFPAASGPIASVAVKMPDADWRTIVLRGSSCIAALALAVAA